MHFRMPQCQSLRSGLYFSGRVLFQYPGNLPELPGLTPVLVRKRTANPVEVVATPITEMLQCDMPYYTLRFVFTFWTILNYNYTFSQKCTY